MTRNDESGDNANLTPTDKLGDVHASVAVHVGQLERWASWFDDAGMTLSANTVRAYLPKPRLESKS